MASVFLKITREDQGMDVRRAMQMAKRLVYEAWGSTLDESLEAAEMAWTVLRTSEDAIEGPKAWLDRREPQFRGR